MRRIAEQLKQDFYRAYDCSKVMSDMSLLPSWQPIGGGRHFNSYFYDKLALPISISIARDSFLDGIEHRRRTWMNGLQTLTRQINHPMVPPMETLWFEESPVYIQPFCKDAVRATRWRAELQNLAEDLDRLGLVYDDYWQVRLYQGHPFVIDWSDLKRRSV